MSQKHCTRAGARGQAQSDRQQEFFSSARDFNTGAAYLNEFAQNWPEQIPPEKIHGHPDDLHFLLYELLESCADEDRIARVSIEQLAAWSGCSADVIAIVLDNLCADECGIVEEVGPRAASTYRICHLGNEGEPVELPISLLRDASITPAAKRAAMGALLNGWPLCGRTHDGDLLVSIPNSRNASPDGLIIEGRRQMEEG